MKKVKVGQKIWAIDPCITFGGQHTLTVGKSYVIEDADDFTIVFIDDLRKSHPMAKINASRYFSITPPKEVKEGECKHCGAENAMRWDKQEVGLDDKQGTWLDLNIRYCEECGKVESYELG